MPLSHGRDVYIADAQFSRSNLGGEDGLFFSPKTKFNGGIIFAKSAKFRSPAVLPKEMSLGTVSCDDN